VEELLAYWTDLIETSVKVATRIVGKLERMQTADTHGRNQNINRLHYALKEANEWLSSQEGRTRTDFYDAVDVYRHVGDTIGAAIVFMSSKGGRLR